MANKHPFDLKKTPKRGVCLARCCGKAPQSRQLLCPKHQSRSWRFRNPAKAGYVKLRSHAKQRGKEFSLTFEEYLSITDMQLYIDGSGRERHLYSIDRIDAAKGYHADNVRVVTCAENSVKAHDDRRAAIVAAKLQLASHSDCDEGEPF